MVLVKHGIVTAQTSYMYVAYLVIFLRGELRGRPPQLPHNLTFPVNSVKAVELILLQTVYKCVEKGTPV